MESSKPSKAKPALPSHESQHLRIGKVVGCHGLKGELKIRPADDDPDWVEVLDQLDLLHPKTGRKAFNILQLSLKDRLVYAKLEGLPDRTAAEVWIGAEVQALTSDLPEAEAGAYRVDELVGLTVVDRQTGQVQGRVQDVLSSTGTDFLEIRLERTGKLVVVPFLEVFFPIVSLEKKELVVDKVGNLEDLASPSPPEGD